MGSFNLRNKSKSGGFMSELYGAWGNTFHSNLLSKSVTTFPSCGRALSCKMSGPSPSKSGRVFVHFFAQFLQPVTLIRCWHFCSTWTSTCHDDSSVIISKDHQLLELWIRLSKFVRSRGVGLLHSRGCDFISGSMSLTHVSSIATFRYRNAWLSTLNLYFSNIAISGRFCFCSAVKQWGTYLAQIFLSCKLFVKIRNTDVGEIPVACGISSHVTRDLVQWSPPQVTHFVNLLIFSAFLAFGHRLWWHVLHENE
jgi:hypothetical protein